MDADLRDLLQGLHAWGRAHDANQREHQDRVRNLEPRTAELISILARSSRRRSLLEIGSSNGYSTIWLAWAASAVGGRVTSVERDRERREMASENLSRAGLRELVDLELGDATDVVAGLPGPFDFVFFDADRVSAPAQFDLLLPKLAPDAMILADNVLSHPGEIHGYLTALEILPDFDRVVVPIGKGLSVAYRGAAIG